MYRAVHHVKSEQCLWTIVSYINYDFWGTGLHGGMILEVVSYERPVHAPSRLHEFRKVCRLVNVWASYSQLELSSNAKNGPVFA